MEYQLSSGTLRAKRAAAERQALLAAEAQRRNRIAIATRTRQMAPFVVLAVSAAIAVPIVWNATRFRP